MSTKSKFIQSPGKGSLFAKADRDTGEVVSISGSLTLSERHNGLHVWLDGTLLDDGAISLLGSVKDHPRTLVSGLLVPQDDNPDYKRGEITIGKVTVKVNSKTMIDRNDAPYRFIWLSNNTVRTGC